MNQRIRWLLFFSGILIIISACNIFEGLNPLENVASEVEGLASQVPMDEIQQEIEKIATSLPADIETLATDLPADLSDIKDEINKLATDLPSGIGDIGDIGDILNEGIGSDKIPSDIPVVDGPKENLFGSENIVSYMTPMVFDTVLSFYQEQMLINGWTPKDGNVIRDDAALLYFEKAGREATVTLSSNPIDDKTVVMIIIQEK